MFGSISNVSANNCSSVGSNNTMICGDIHLEGRQVTIKGKRHRLPSDYRSTSIINNELWIDGKRFKPQDEEEKNPDHGKVRTSVFKDRLGLDLRFEVLGATTVKIRSLSEDSEETGIVEVETTGDSKDPDSSRYVRFEQDKRLELLDNLESSTVTIFLNPKSKGTVIVDNCSECEMDQCLVPLVTFDLKASREVKVKDSYCNRLKMYSMSGDCIVRKTQAGVQLSMETLSGQIDVDNKMTFQSGRFNSMSGDIEINGLCPDTTKSIQCKTMSGDICVTGAPTGCLDLTAETMSGDLRGRGPRKPKFDTMTGRNRFKVE